MDRVNVVFLGNCHKNLDLKKIKKYFKKLNFVSFNDLKISTMPIADDYISLASIDNHVMDDNCEVTIFLTNLLEEDHFFAKTNYLNYDAYSFKKNKTATPTIGFFLCA